MSEGVAVLPYCSVGIPRTAVIIDEWPPLAETVADVLTKQGYRTTLALTPAAVQRLHQAPPSRTVLVASIPSPLLPRGVLEALMQRHPGLNVLAMVPHGEGLPPTCPPRMRWLAKPFGTRALLRTLRALTGDG